MTLHVGAMWVEPASRGEGVGRSLLAEVLAWGRDSGAVRAELWVVDDDGPAQRLYETAGFTKTGETDSLRPGSDPDVAAMARNI